MCVCGGGHELISPLLTSSVVLTFSLFIEIYKGLSSLTGDL